MSICLQVIVCFYLHLVMYCSMLCVMASEFLTLLGMCISCAAHTNDGFDASCLQKFGLENVG
jgi:hypothetical protein